MTAAEQSAPMTLEQWCALGEDTSVRSELERGVLVVSPRPRLAHVRAVVQLTAQLRAQLPPALTVYPEVDLVIDAGEPATVRVPDLAVVRAGACEPLHARDAVLVVEVLSPSSGRIDRIAKRAEYEAAGIPAYWIIDADEQAAEILTLTGRGYESGEGGATAGMIRTSTPVPLLVDLTDLDY